MMIFSLHPDLTPEDLGMLPQMLSDEDPRPAKEQFDEQYAHGGGWLPMHGLTMERYTLHYPGDPPFKPIAMMVLRNETILIYEHSIVAILQADGTFEACRMD